VRVGSADAGGRFARAWRAWLTAADPVLLRAVEADPVAFARAAWDVWTGLDYPLPLLTRFAGRREAGGPVLEVWFAGNTFDWDGRRYPLEEHGIQFAQEGQKALPQRPVALPDEARIARRMMAEGYVWFPATREWQVPPHLDPFRQELLRQGFRWNEALQAWEQPWRALRGGHGFRDKVRVPKITQAFLNRS
jgi:hypothetical protein